MPTRDFAGNRMIYSGRQSSSGAARQFNLGRVNQVETIAPYGTNSRFVQNRTRPIANQRKGVGQIDNGNSLPSTWRNHVVAQHSGNWHRDWDRHHDHWWHGHRCRFINGSWVIFDLGFYPWGSYGYPYWDDYYPYYSDYYAQQIYEGGVYYGNDHDADQTIDATVAAAQEQLVRAGYYGGEIDGVLGPQTRQAIAHYQSNHGQPATGHLTTTTLQALGLGRVAND